MSDKLGIVAGSGRLPVQLAATCDSEARPHFVAALEGLAKPGEFQKFPHETIPLASYGRLIDAMRGQGCTDIVLAGGVGRPVLAGLAPDERGLKLLPRLVKAAGKAGGLLGELVKAIEENGFQVIAAQDVAAGLLVGPGPLGGHEADDPARKSIQLAVRAIHGRRDEGIQAALATPDHLLGIEDPDGTDAMISRWAESTSIRVCSSARSRANSWSRVAASWTTSRTSRGAFRMRASMAE